MGLERKGTQFRIRLRPKERFQKKSFVTLDVGKKGGLQFVSAVPKGKRIIDKNLKKQSLRISTKDFNRVGGKLIPKTVRGKIEVRSLKRRKTGAIGKAIKKYF